MKIILGVMFCFAFVVIVLTAPYSGPQDTRVVSGGHDLMYSTSIGQLVKLSTTAGVGQVIDKGHLENPEDEIFSDYLKIRVLQPLFGCVSNEVITVLEGKQKQGGASAGWSSPEEDAVYEEASYFDAYPTNHGHVVFSVSTNYYPNTLFWSAKWDPDLSENKIHKRTSLPFLRYETRSWWYTDYQDGLPLAYFTNVVRTMRTQRNWTNYYAVCRDGASSSSVRVKEDSFHDLRFFTFHATDEQLQYIENDPLKTPDSITYIPHVRRVRQEREERTRQQESQ